MTPQEQKTMNLVFGQFNLTAIRYAERFNVPMLYAYELRGSTFDADKAYHLIKPIFGE